MSFKLNYRIIHLLLVVVACQMSSCANQKVISSWNAEGFSPLLKERNLLLVKADIDSVRQWYEEGLSAKFDKKDIDVSESILKYPELDPNLDRTDEEKQAIVQTWLEAGYKGFIAVRLNNLIEIVKSSEPVKIDKAYRDSNQEALTGEDKSSEALSVDSQYEIDKSNVSTTYILEVLTYNLELEKDEQLVGVILIEITNLEQAKIVKSRKKFLSLIVKEFLH